MEGKFARLEYLGEHFANVILMDGRVVQVRRSALTPAEGNPGVDLDPNAEILKVFPHKPPEKSTIVFFDPKFLERVDAETPSAT